jgi:putative transposase
VARAAVRAIAARHDGADHELLAWVLMPDHLHALILLGENDSLPALVNRLKSNSARAVKTLLKRDRPVWQRSYHDHGMRREEDLRAAARYIVANPLRAGLVKRIGEYPHWDANWL